VLAAGLHIRAKVQGLVVMLECVDVVSKVVRVNYLSLRLYADFSKRELRVGLIELTAI
jgi:hypothetical protein